MDIFGTMVSYSFYIFKILLASNASVFKFQSFQVAFVGILRDVRLSRCLRARRRLEDQVHCTFFFFFFFVFFFLLTTEADFFLLSNDNIGHEKLQYSEVHGTYSNIYSLNTQMRSSSLAFALSFDTSSCLHPSRSFYRPLRSFETALLFTVTKAPHASCSGTEVGNHKSMVTWRRWEILY